MKHSIRQRVLDPVTGLKVTKIQTVNGELGSGIVDKNGREIFEGDMVDTSKGRLEVVLMHGGEFCVASRIPPIASPLIEVPTDELEVVGHVGD